MNRWPLLPQWRVPLETRALLLYLTPSWPMPLTCTMAAQRGLWRDDTRYAAWRLGRKTLVHDSHCFFAINTMIVVATGSVPAKPLIFSQW
jgi:hypothetical protein